ncbi:hypothetical protein GOP47_0013611 [Adiantum capillus-veneris]|uniref:GDSL esterase/lipase n=1 Tax=Adiantum capillus-veneris TaxID=13818 RepID=A0A9D4UP31_ADICA|nr:hypothetical protein GOP47_0013611 [Adiantum capillus-veneris]
MFGFGDSLSDTGNMLIALEAQNASQIPIQGALPYGETFFHRPVGRFSDGRLFVDFLVEKLGASNYLQPSFALLYQNRNTTQGSPRNLVNFAMAGATALSAEFFNATFNITPYSSYSLAMQLQGLSNITSFRDTEALSRALIFFGEIGGNDYNYAFGNRVPLDRIHDLIPNVITQIKSALQTMVDNGIQHFVVQSAYPMGCIPLYKKTYANATRDAYGCLQDINTVVHQHNMLLSELVDNLTVHYNNSVQFILLDSNKAFMEIYSNPPQYGFTYRERPCYDISDYFLDLQTNITGVQACADPSSHMIWDGPHPTEAMSKAVFNLFSTQDYVKPYPNFLTSNSRVIV